jgi:hypothetical protein
MTDIPEITALSATVPQLGQADPTFDANMNAWIPTLYPFQTQANAMAVAMNLSSAAAEVSANNSEDSRVAAEAALATVTTKESAFVAASDAAIGLAASTVGASAWVSGEAILNTGGVSETVISQEDFQVYYAVNPRTSLENVTDPANDPYNFQLSPVFQSIAGINSRLSRSRSFSEI